MQQAVLQRWVAECQARSWTDRTMHSSEQGLESHRFWSASRWQLNCCDLGKPFGTRFSHYKMAIVIVSTAQD